MQYFPAERQTRSGTVKQFPNAPNVTTIAAFQITDNDELCACNRITLNCSAPPAIPPSPAKPFCTAQMQSISAAP
ncbi:hypothetical protein CDT90_020820, partial [Cronobacter sakazakii]